MLSFHGGSLEIKVLFRMHWMSHWKERKKWFEQVLCKGFNYVSHICAQKERSYNGTIRCTHRPRGFNDSVHIPESCGFRSQFDPLNIICQLFFLNSLMHFEFV